jgi:O-antigen/teichoic acid export membrane protein
MDEKVVKKNSIVSVLSLFFQSGYSAVLGFAANIALTIFLDPKIFGIYITVLSIIALLNYFSDIGLAASLIQRKEITKNDIKTAFTIQQILILSILTVAYLLTNFVVSFYKLPSDGRIL